MKRTAYSLLLTTTALALVFALPALAQDDAMTSHGPGGQTSMTEHSSGLTLHQVLANYYKAMGGLDKIKSVKTQKATGKMTMGPAGEVPFTMEAKRPNKVRIEFTFQGMKGIQAYDGTTAWMFMPFMGKTAPEQMPEAQAKDMKEQADIDGPLVDYQEKGNKVELVGKKEVQGSDAYELKVTLKDGDVRNFFLDADAFVPIMVTSVHQMQGNPVEVETTLGDYKEVDGLMMPFSITSKPKGAPEGQGQTITIDKMELNQDIPDSDFTMPKTAPAAKAEGGNGSGSGLR
ncbi:MAG TPA: outer membrane lipoprotein-sorting protein [Thermoanaerobaculia bacterium]|nr:outer membrane lipoprotein-sorting protein [Thermoanaerobaculia bacterium]